MQRILSTGEGGSRNAIFFEVKCLGFCSHPCYCVVESTYMYRKDASK